MSTTDRKQILVTGASGGMGRVCAEKAAAEGYNLILADLAAEGMEQVATELADSGVSVRLHRLDVTDVAAVNDLADSIQSAGGVDAMIHTIGVSPNMTSWQRIVDIDLVSTARFMETMRPVMKSGAAAVCISSSSGYMVPTNAVIEALLTDPLRENLFEQLKSLPDNPLENAGLAYSYAKKALRYYVADRAMAWGKEGKRLVSISPGLIDTEAGQKEYAVSNSFAQMISRVPLNRLGLPAEIVHTALFLVSDKASYISGCDILVDGGLIAGMGMSRPIVADQ